MKTEAIILEAWNTAKNSQKFRGKGDGNLITGLSTVLYKDGTLMTLCTLCNKDSGGELLCKEILKFLRIGDGKIPLDTLDAIKYLTLAYTNDTNRKYSDIQSLLIWATFLKKLSHVYET